VGVLILSTYYASGYNIDDAHLSLEPVNRSVEFDYVM